MELKGVHFLLTYKCDLECAHCFVWSGPQAEGALTLRKIREILREAKKLRTVTYVSIEGGEPFLYYPIMVRTAQEAAKLGFRVEILSNCYWASCLEDAVEWLLPLAKTKDLTLSLSSDLYHGHDWETDAVRNAVKAAKGLHIKVGILAIKHTNTEAPCPTHIEGASVDLCEIMYKGRAFKELAEQADKKPWHEFTKCPYEDFTRQERVHIDPFGHVHVCQGISIGNAWQKPFSKLIRDCDPQKHPILEPLIRGGPVALVKDFHLLHEDVYADACHLCYAARCSLRERYPDVLAPDQMYGKDEQA